MHKSKNSCSCNISEESAAATAAAIRPSALLLASSASLAPNGNAPEPACRSHGWNGIELGMHSLNATTPPEMSLGIYMSKPIRDWKESEARSLCRLCFVADYSCESLSGCCTLVLDLLLLLLPLLKLPGKR